MWWSNDNYGDGDIWFDDDDMEMPDIDNPQELPEKEVTITLEELANEGLPENYYDDFNKIGEGAAGEVFVCKSKKDGKDYALKKCVITAKNQKSLTNEIEIMIFSLYLLEVVNVRNGL